MEMDDMINVVFMPANTTCIVQLMEQGVISLRSTLHKAIVGLPWWCSG